MHYVDKIFHYERHKMKSKKMSIGQTQDQVQQTTKIYQSSRKVFLGPLFPTQYTLYKSDYFCDCIFQKNVLYQ